MCLFFLNYFSRLKEKQESSQECNFIVIQCGKTLALHVNKSKMLISRRSSFQFSFHLLSSAAHFLAENLDLIPQINRLPFLEYYTFLR